MSARVWRCGSRELVLNRPLVMGILNVTPDSFSGDGIHSDADEAVEHATAMASAGARIIDVGGESTRPGSAAVDIPTERARVLPVVERLVAELDVAISIDTRHAEVADACVRAGVSVINDITGFRHREMREVAKGCDAGLVVMHMLGDDPATMQNDPHYTDVVAEVCGFLTERAEALRKAGVDPARIAVDPGIGFGKTLAHNLALLRGLDTIAALGYAVVVGVSRKRFIGRLLGEDDPAHRVWGSVGAAAYSAMHDADVVRVHDVAETSDALRVIAAIQGHGS